MVFVFTQSLNAQGQSTAISPADSAKAIEGFITASGGSGMFYQYSHTVLPGKRYPPEQQKRPISQDTSTTSVTEAGNLRNEFTQGGIKSIYIRHSNQPKYDIYLHPQSNAYELHSIDSSDGGVTYSAIKIGSETIQGYACIHARLIMTITVPKPGIPSQRALDLWMSQDVPGYPAYKQLAAKAIDGGRSLTPKMMKTLEQAGCTGFIVKLENSAVYQSSVMLLIHAEQKSFPSSAFEIPPGYLKW